MAGSDYGQAYTGIDGPTHIWQSWNSGTASTGDVWYTWCTSTDSTTSATPNNITYIATPAVKLTKEQKAENVARRAREKKEANERIAKRAAAKEKAEELLLSLLDENQREDLKENNSFVILSELEKRYRIRRGRVMNVTELDEQNKRIASYCAHPFMSVPDADTMVSQLLMLQHNEQEFLSIANRRLAH